MRRALAISLLFAAAACGGAGGRGALVLTRPDGITTYDLRSAEERTLVTLPKEYRSSSSVADPAISPGGERVAFVVVPPLGHLPEGGFDSSTDVWAVDRRGGEPRALYRHPAPNHYVRFPTWIDEATILAVVRTGAPETGTFAYAIERIDLNTGERTKVVEGGLAFGLSRDGERMAYVTAEGGVETLHTSDSTGANATQVLKASDHKLGNIGARRFSPDGKRVAFLEPT